MNGLEKEFIPYEQALALKELGFDEPCFARHVIMTEWEKPTGQIILQMVDCLNSDKHLVKSPLYQQSFKFFRENRHLKFFIKEDDFRESVYEYGIKEVINITGFKTYEQAELECLKKLIELVYEKKIKK